MHIVILTLFPQMFEGPFKLSIIKNAVGKKLVEISFVNIRDFGIGKHKVVDDKPFGGGNGMILRVDVLKKAIEFAKTKNKSQKKQRVILLDPRGKTFSQKKAREFSKLEKLIIICGHYEGVDERVKNFIDEKISIGDFIATGGEIPAMLITDSVVRLLKGSLKKGVTDIESFSPILEYPQYTRPRVYYNYSVPETLFSGNHREIQDWKKEASLKETKKNRPDLL